MKIAVLADIHSNHIALEKCLEQAKLMGAEVFLFLGDYVGEMPCPEKTLEILEAVKKEYPCTFIRGNKEDYWIDHKKGKHFDWIWESGKSSSGMLRYAYDRLTPAQIDAFEAMPIAKTMEYPDMPSFTICHGSPFQVNESLRPDLPHNDELTKRLENRMTICAHFHQQVEYMKNGKWVINPGSVGMPLYSDGKAQFMMLFDRGGIWEKEFISRSYDVEKAIAEMDEERLGIQAPAWYRVTKAVLNGFAVSQARVLDLAFRLCEQAEGKANWKDIPEKYWDMALNEYGI
ncbi:MAG: metallophosphatase family protein [Lachnospiraceae bacterium]|nr:metallophosphatase family protein [Lachnospiraceae bacterium]